jgi:uncharacterized protein
MVKVLDVDVPRKRISLTLRLDDEVTPGGPKEDRGQAGQGGRQRNQPRGGQTGGGQSRGGQTRGGQGGRDRGGQGGRPRGDSAPVNSAMADALRRAGFTG